MIAPIFNVDGTDTFVTQDGSLGSETPYIQGVRENSEGLDLNRDSVKLRTVEARGLYRVLNEWDPVLLLDGHLMSRVSHGYANTYGTTTVPAAAPGPRDYTHDTLFPAVRDMVRRDFGLEVFTHALSDRQWPPTVWSHDRAAWTVEAKFIVNDYGLRNRLAIITETPGQPTFERRIYAQYAYMAALLDYTNSHAKEIQGVVKAADEETVAKVIAGAESGQLKNFLDGEYRSRGKINLLAYKENVAEFRRGTSLLGTRPGTADGQPEVVPNVDDLTMPVGTREAYGAARLRVPRGHDRRCGDASHPQRQDPHPREAHAPRGGTIHGQGRTEGAQQRIRHDGARRGLLRAARRRIPGRLPLRGHGPADGQRGVLLPRASGTGWIRRLGPAGRDVARARCGRARRDLPDLQGPARSEIGQARRRGSHKESSDVFQLDDDDHRPPVSTAAANLPSRPRRQAPGRAVPIELVQTGQWTRKLATLWLVGWVIFSLSLADLRMRRDSVMSTWLPFRVCAGWTRFEIAPITCLRVSSASSWA